jgi:hypothetical protein
MRRHLFLTLLALALSVSSARAGRIFGDIKMDGKPLPAGVPVMVTAPVAADAGKGEAKDDSMPEAKAAKAVRADSAATDKFGAYKLNVKAEGKCTLTVLFEKQPVTLEVFSYKEPTRYDLILEKKEGKLSLRRK